MGIFSSKKDKVIITCPVCGKPIKGSGYTSKNERICSECYNGVFIKWDYLAKIV